MNSSRTMTKAMGNKMSRMTRGTKMAMTSERIMASWPYLCLDGGRIDAGV